MVAVAIILSGVFAHADVARADSEYRDHPAGPRSLKTQTAATLACNLTGRKPASLPP